MYIYKDSDYLPEQSVIKYYEEKGYKAIWSENSFWWEIMCLLFWDIIFARVFGAIEVIENGRRRVVSPNESIFNRIFDSMISRNGMPNDFFSNRFYSNREKLIKNRFAELKRIDYFGEIRRFYNNNKGKACRPIENWNKYSLDELLEPLKYINKNVVLSIIQRLLSNFVELRSGIPDLVVYTDNFVLFVEVKSEKDKLSDRQRGWITYLSDKLEQKVVIFLINHSEKQMQNIEESLKSYKETPTSLNMKLI